MHEYFHSNYLKFKYNSIKHTYSQYKHNLIYEQIDRISHGKILAHEKKTIQLGNFGI